MLWNFVLAGSVFVSSCGPSAVHLSFLASVSICTKTFSTLSRHVQARLAPYLIYCRFLPAILTCLIAVTEVLILLMNFFDARFAIRMYFDRASAVETYDSFAVAGGSGR